MPSWQPNLLATSPDADARGSARRADEAHGTACHSAITPPPPHLTERDKGLRIKVWNGANKIEVERVIDKLHEMPPKKTEQSKRGKVTVCTWKSMRRMRMDMAEMDANQDAYTSALTFPSHLRHLCPEASGAKIYFQALQRWINKKYRWLGIYWKREPQKNGVTHYHLLYFLNGHSEEKVLAAMGEILRKWCEITTGKGTAFPTEEHEKQLAVHLHEKNRQPVKKGESFFNYLGKYLSKDGGNVPEGYNNEGGGRWWGKVNADMLPRVEPKEKTIKLADVTEKQVMRMIYRLRDARKQAAYDALHPTDHNPRAVCFLITRHLNTRWGWSLKKSRKWATRAKFRVQGSRLAPAAPIKAKANWHYGTSTFLGDPAKILDYVQRMICPKPDFAARKRIFADKYVPSDENG